MTDAVAITINVNGETISQTVEPRLSLADFLRAEGLTGTHLGCEHGVCGACTVQVDGRTARGCLTLAIQCNGLEVETIEGATDKGSIVDLQEAFVEHNALQCGFCTPGMLMSVDELLRDNPSPSRDEIRDHLSGNYCRCTGYQSIVDAVEQVARQRAGGAQ
ncbi:MAG: (2Fe-2S)-binding protein [Rhodospirillaceae bacterium]|jgi:aerobic carbon-monoxide dehydrogenase small subunit|nr:(2Fe-2S)-binding protein [Rhodospirillaceae bacterium]MBT5013715.1 (2Fe-2S)-binding protein [Rhodospirillaceae bacterium]MBT5308931.1 (2Fe-2S)-binding protein [Rhodospirillaceae bacterium]MBT6407644.1 (2Fe-2S)-binding protein [Rhodospirillaceae bacterium]MBT7357038.1 (2Fe-2S)-binding protein [Rhodospirillaceae bacterium]